jgi:transcriptional regulator with XRE-family HTH domain
VEKFDLDNVLKIVSLDNELELNRANELQLKLRLMAKNDPELLAHRKHLRDLIKKYEAKYWSNDSEIDKKQIALSDIAEEIAQNENVFLNARKKLIKKELKKLSLTQQDLGTILGHRKSYMSELLNGVRTLSMTDIIAIHKLLNIELKLLIPPFLNDEKRAMLNQNLKKLQKPNLKIDKKDLELDLI